MAARTRRPGFTLLEVMIVSALLLALAAISYPSLKSSYGYYKLHGGIDSVRAAWAQARAHAIEEGRAYRFSVEPGGSHFRVAPDADNEGEGKGLVLEQALPGGVRFTVNGSPAADLPDDFTPPGQEKKANVSGSSWSPTVVFLPDGTAKEDVHILFQVRGVNPAKVHLRGLTGTVSVESVHK